MNVNGISNVYDAYSAYNTKSPAKKADTSSKDTASNASDEAVVYESSGQTIDREALIAQMKADTNQRVNQLKSLVESLMTTQAGKASTLADLFRNLNPDSATIEQAKQEISEDGYWGVNQTSDRIFEFAKALSGGDSDKMEEMLEAFKKGYQQATKSWGEKLPDICSDTYDAVLKKFEDYKNSIEE